MGDTSPLLPEAADAVASAGGRVRTTPVGLVGAADVGEEEEANELEGAPALRAKDAREASCCCCCMCAESARGLASKSPAVSARPPALDALLIFCGVCGRCCEMLAERCAKLCVDAASASASLSMLMTARNLSPVIELDTDGCPLALEASYVRLARILDGDLMQATNTTVSDAICL